MTTPWDSGTNPLPQMRLYVQGPDPAEMSRMRVAAMTRKLKRFCEAHLRRAVHEYVKLDHRKCNHLGLGNQLLDAAGGQGSGAVVWAKSAGQVLSWVILNALAAMEGPD